MKSPQGDFVLFEVDWGGVQGVQLSQRTGLGVSKQKGKRLMDIILVAVIGLCMTIAGRFLLGSLMGNFMAALIVSEAGAVILYAVGIYFRWYTKEQIYGMVAAMIGAFIALLIWRVGIVRRINV